MKKKITIITSIIAFVFSLLGLAYLFLKHAMDDFPAFDISDLDFEDYD